MVTAMCSRGAARAVPVVTWGLPEQARVSGTSLNPHLSKIKKEMGKKEKNKRKKPHHPPRKGAWLPKQNPAFSEGRVPSGLGDFEKSCILVSVPAPVWQ